jgi:hypothetical protein
MDTMHPKAAELLKAVEREFNKVSRPYTPVLGAFIGTMAVVLILSAYEISPWWSLLLLVPSFAVARRMQRATDKAVLLLPARIEQSALLDKLLLGPREVADIYQWTPWPWSSMFLGFKPNNLPGWIRVVARNVEWYLDEPRRYFRLLWVAQLLALVVPFLTNAPIFFLHGASFDAFEQYATLMGSFLLGVSVFYMIVAAEGARQLAAMRALRNLIKLRFEELPEGV